MKYQHVYQLAIRRADDEKKQFIIETDLVYNDEKLSKKFAEEISQGYKCDVKLTYLGRLLESKQDEVIDITYHSKEMIASYVEQWKEKEREAFVNGTAN